MTADDNLIYFIGAGPGNMKYLTQEGKEILSKCGLVYAVDPYPVTFAPLLVKRTVRDPLKRVFDELTEEVKEALPSTSVGFLVPGDMTVFSPFMPIVEHFSEQSRVIAGVGILNASAALLKHTLDMPGVSHSVLLTSPKYFNADGDGTELRRLARTAGTLVLYMNNRRLEDLAFELSVGFEPDTPVVIASRVGMEDERVYRCTLSTMAEAVGKDDIFGIRSGDPSLALIIIGEALDAGPGPEFWDKSKKKYWDRGKQ